MSRLLSFVICLMLAAVPAFGQVLQEGQSVSGNSVVNIKNSGTGTPYGPNAVTANWAKLDVKCAGKWRTAYRALLRIELK